MNPSILIIVSQFNELVTRSLEDGAVSWFREHDYQRIEILRVPGAFEMPVVAACAAHSGKYDAIVCLGAVIKGETPHFDFVAGQCAAGLMKVSVDYRIPVSFGLLTTNTVAEALDRAGLKMGNKGREAAETAIRMVQTVAPFRGKEAPAGRSHS